MPRSKSTALRLHESTDLAQRAEDLRDRYLAFKRRTWLEAAGFGQELLDAKASLKHGQWLPWLTLTGIEERTARNFMELAPLVKSEKFSDLPSQTPVSIVLRQAREARRNGSSRHPQPDPETEPIDASYTVIDEPNGQVHDEPPAADEKPIMTTELLDFIYRFLALLDNDARRSGLATYLLKPTPLAEAINRLRSHLDQIHDAHVLDANRVTLHG